MKFFQKLGKSLMLPVCVLPICGILMGIGYLLCPASMQGGEVTGVGHIIGYLLVKAGSAAIDNMSVLFVIGVAIGMSDDGHGSAALAGIVSWFVITTLLSTKCMSVVFGGLDTDSYKYIAYSKIQNPTIGIIAGIIGAKCYNRFKNTKLPDFLAFFSGRRSVAIVTVLVSLAAAAVLAVVWPICFSGMVVFGRWIVSAGGIGAGIYAFLNRLLIPTGMHHALNNVFWFDTIGLGDLTNFWAGKTSHEVGWSLGMYMSGFFPCMIGGIPGAALAFYHCAKNKKKAAGVLFSTAFCAFLCGLTEPFEFSFMFLCFPLYVVYSILFGIFSVITYFVGFRAGFSFSAGMVDLIFSSTLPAAEKTWMILPLSLAAFGLFYISFRFVIKKFHLQAFGGDDEESAVPAAGDGAKAVSADEKDLVTARGLLQAVGGKENVISSDCCATRLRLELKDSTLVDRKMAKRFGAIDCLCPSKTSCQIIIGLTVQQKLEAFRKVMEEKVEEKPAENTEFVAGKAEPVSETANVSEVPAVPMKEEKTAEVRHAGPVVAHGQPIRIPLKKGVEPVEKSGSAEDSEEKKEEIREKKEEVRDGGSFVYAVKDPSGIHARPAAQIAGIVKKYNAKVTMEAGGRKAAAGIPIQIMSLGAKCGTEITVTAEGDPKETETVLGELEKFFSDNL